MILTLATRSLSSRIVDGRNAGDRPPAALTLCEVPEYAITSLLLRGMNVPASMLSGWSLQDLDHLRDRADKAGCPCLVLIEDRPLAFADGDPAQRKAAGERVQRLAAAAHRLGCNALGISFDAPDTDEAFDRVATEVREVMPSLERLELNVLLEPSQGLTFQPDRLTDLIKRIGGFRIGSLPSFGHAAATGDAVGALRKLAPYAGAVHATIEGFTRSGRHRGYDLAACVTAIRSVGFVNTLAIDYRGSTDPAANIERAREALQQALESES